MKFAMQLEPKPQIQLTPRFFWPGTSQDLLPEDVKRTVLLQVSESSKTQEEMLNRLDDTEVTAHLVEAVSFLESESNESTVESTCPA